MKSRSVVVAFVVVVCFSGLSSILGESIVLTCPESENGLDILQYCRVQSVTNFHNCIDICRPEVETSTPYPTDIHCPENNDPVSVVKYCSKRGDRRACIKTCHRPRPTDRSSAPINSTSANFGTVRDKLPFPETSSPVTPDISSHDPLIKFQVFYQCPKSGDLFDIDIYCSHETVEDHQDCVNTCVRETSFVASIVTPISCPVDRGFLSLVRYCSEQSDGRGCINECYRPDPMDSFFLPPKLAKVPTGISTDDVIYGMMRLFPPIPATPKNSTQQE